MIKRMVDIAVSVLALLVTAPLLFILALLIKSGSPGPVFFRQERVGRGGKAFNIMKFRSMEERKGTLSATFDPGDTSRVTSVGKFIRKTKLDELPQFFNVLKGDMSVVGPRPEIKKWVDVYPDRWAKILQVRPGITDPASLEFHNEEEVLASYEDPENAYRTIVLPKKLDLYERYIDNRTLILDIKVIFGTFMKLFKG